MRKVFKYVIFIIPIVLLVILLLIGTVAITFPISGKVVNSETQEPIKDAVIFTSIRYQEFSPVHAPWKGTDFKFYKTDADGIFHIPFSINFVVPLYQSGAHRVGSVVAVGYVANIKDYTPTSDLYFKPILGINFLSNKTIDLKPILTFEDYNNQSLGDAAMPSFPESEKYREYINTTNNLLEQQKKFGEQKFGPLTGNLIKIDSTRAHIGTDCERITDLKNKRNCIFEVTEEKAVLSGDYKICNELNQGLKEFIGTPYEEGNSNLFSESIVGYLVDRCYGSVAKQTKNKDICTQIKETQSFFGTYLRSECYNSI